MVLDSFTIQHVQPRRGCEARKSDRYGQQKDRQQNKRVTQKEAKELARQDRVQSCALDRAKAEPQRVSGPFDMALSVHSHAHGVALLLAAWQGSPSAEAHPDNAPAIAGWRELGDCALASQGALEAHGLNRAV